MALMRPGDTLTARKLESINMKTNVHALMNLEITHTFTKKILGATNLMTMGSPPQTRISPISAYATQQTYQLYEEGHTDHELRIQTCF